MSHGSRNPNQSIFCLCVFVGDLGRDGIHVVFENSCATRLSQFGHSIRRDLVESSVHTVFCCGTVLQNETDANVDMEHPHSPNYKMWYACKVQAALCRSIRGGITHFTSRGPPAS